MASNLFPSNTYGLQPKSDGLQPKSDDLQPSSDGLQPNSDGLQPKSDGLHPSSDGLQANRERERGRAMRTFSCPGERPASVSADAASPVEAGLQAILLVDDGPIGCQFFFYHC